MTVSGKENRSNEIRSNFSASTQAPVSSPPASYFVMPSPCTSPPRSLETSVRGCAFRLANPQMPAPTLLPAFSLILLSRSGGARRGGGKRAAAAVARTVLRRRLQRWDDACCATVSQQNGDQSEAGDEEGVTRPSVRAAAAAAARGCPIFITIPAAPPESGLSGSCSRPQADRCRFARRQRHDAKAGEGREGGERSSVGVSARAPDLSVTCPVVT